MQSTFNALGGEIKGKTLALGGDGRYFNKQAAQIIIKLAAGNGLKKVSHCVSPLGLRALMLHGCVNASLAQLQVIVGKDAIMATPAASAVIRRRKLAGGLIMSASHNPGAPAATETRKAVQAAMAGQH